MRKKSIIFFVFLILIFTALGCTDKKQLQDIQNTQQEILKKIAVIEKNQEEITKLFQPRRPAVDYNAVQNIPVGTSPIKGNKNAPVAIVEFSDFQCPYCAQLQPTLREVLKAYPKDVKLVFKNFPLPFHEQARNAAKASLAAGEQGKFWAMHDIIFENYNSLSDERFKVFASQIGLNVKKFMEDYSSNKYDNQILEDINLGRNAGVNGTPTLFVNGKRAMNRSFEDFKRMIDEALKK